MSATPEQCTRADELCTAIYVRNEVGCCWHIVLGDLNLDDSSVRFCAADAGKSGHRDCGPECAELAPIMLAMTVEQRRNVRCARDTDDWTLGEILDFEEGKGRP
jgi:hypothetical protein